MKNKNFPTPLILENSYLKNQGLEVSILTCNTDLLLLQVLKDTLYSFNEDQGLCLYCFLLYSESSTQQGFPKYLLIYEMNNVSSTCYSYINLFLTVCWRMIFCLVFNIYKL